MHVLAQDITFGIASFLGERLLLSVGSHHSIVYLKATFGISMRSFGYFCIELG
jgi:hypothetical protein